MINQTWIAKAFFEEFSQYKYHITKCCGRTVAYQIMLLIYNQRVGSSIPSSAYAPRQGILDTIVSFNPEPHFTKFWYQW